MLKRILEPRTEGAYAFLRILSGFMFSFHGVQKIFRVLTDHAPPLLSQIWIGGLIELVGGVLIMLGLFTRWAAFIASGTMAVAYTQFHWRLQLGAQFFPTVNKGELAALYAALFLFIACRGSGIWSLKRD